MTMNALRRTSRRPPPTAAEQAAARVAWYLSLAHCFRPPEGPGTVEAMRGALPGDLRDITEELGLSRELGPPLDALQQTLERCPDYPTLLKDYSWLFLNPPYRVDLNAGMYLDGSLMGQTSRQLTQCYRRYGVERPAHAGELPDHLSILLEFGAVLWSAVTEALESGDTARANQAQRDHAWLLHQHLLRWVPAMGQRLDRLCGQRRGAVLYAALVSLANAMAEAEFRELRQSLPDGGRIEPASAAVVRQELPPVSDRLLACTACGETFTLRGERAAIHAKLEEAGLDASHVAICKRCGR